MIAPAHEFDVPSCDWNEYDEFACSGPPWTRQSRSGTRGATGSPAPVLNGHGYAVREVIFSLHRLYRLVEDAVLGSQDHHSDFALLVEGLLATTGWDEPVYVWQHGADPKAV
ncbi:peroxisome biogenesis protein 7-like [Juglans microcarpa x Juglans regia]|uniref:peroxisome biogenesis protein 7-like n=1 Tax=Juglans microcarpa x Juglans regia TaxID=2249226 RepID=UPI001B7E5ADA|nr:peroxisome biogenesis protein 7-like [Juglans microcarpa x Juglans regia]